VSNNKENKNMKSYSVSIGQYIIISVDAENEEQAIAKAKTYPSYDLAVSYNDAAISVEEMPFPFIDFVNNRGE
jgi:glutamyl/glutaminyl-tRNA synthetase